MPNRLCNADTVEDSADIIHAIERWKIDNIYLYYILFLQTNVVAQKLVEPFEETAVNDGAGDGRAASGALVNQYNGISNAGCVSSYRVLRNSRLQPDMIFTSGCTQWTGRGAGSMNMGRSSRTNILQTRS